MSSSFHTVNITEVRIQRKVFHRWNNLVIKIKDRSGSESIFTFEGPDYELDHKPIPVTWEKPDLDPMSTSDLAEMKTPIELFNITHLNQPEDPRIEAIKEVLKENPINETVAIMAIEEILFGPKTDSVASSSIDDILPDDEIPY